MKASFMPRSYDQTREEVIAAFKFYVREEARDYEREFPAQPTKSGTGFTDTKARAQQTVEVQTSTVEHVYRLLQKATVKFWNLRKSNEKTVRQGEKVASVLVRNRR